MEMSTQTKSKLSKVIYLVAATFLAFRAEAQTATPPAEQSPAPSPQPTAAAKQRHLAEPLQEPLPEGLASFRLPKKVYSIKAGKLGVARSNSQSIVLPPFLPMLRYWCAFAGKVANQRAT